MLTRSIVLGLGSFGFGILNFCGNSEFLALVEVRGRSGYDPVGA
ncbi:hypothetical protein [Microcoleus sp. bin38.metabat.b11b12b14.051]|nr:hypothetical protein [Microcoleus sp. bin38.metabat.b11b12b14.051]